MNNTMLQKIVCFLVVLLLAGSFACVKGLASVEPTPESVLKAHLEVTMGDANGDHLVNAQDALLALQFSVRKIGYIPFGYGGTAVTDVPFEADLSGDGKVDAADALQMLKISVGKQQVDPQFLEPDQFQCISFSLPQENYISPQIIKTAQEWEEAKLPTHMKERYKNFTFDTHSLLVFSVPITAQETPQAVQVAINGANVLVRYEYREVVEAEQYALLVVIPKEAGENLNTLYGEPINFAHKVEPTLYSFEYLAQAMIEIEYPTYEVIQTREEALKVAEFMKCYDFTDEAMEQFLFYRIESGFFDTNKIVVWFDHDKHGITYPKCEIQSIEEGQKAVVMLKGPLGISDSHVTARSTFRMQLLDVPKDLAKGYKKFVLAPASGVTVTATDIPFEQGEVLKLSTDRNIGFSPYLSNGWYVETYEQLEEYWGTSQDWEWFPKEKYNQEYFENHALILFNGLRKTSGYVNNTVTRVMQFGNEVTVEVSQVQYTGEIYTCDVYENLCVVELTEKLSHADTLHIVANYQLIDQSQEEPQVKRKSTIECVFCLDQGEWV